MSEMTELIVLVVPKHGGPPDNDTPFAELTLATLKEVLARSTVPGSPAAKLAASARLVNLDGLEKSVPELPASPNPCAVSEHREAEAWNAAIAALKERLVGR